MALCVFFLTAGCPYDHDDKNLAATVSFVAFGDWGENVESQKEVAGALKGFCENNECEFVLTLGDNFYPSGVSSTDDSQWEDKYRLIYGELGIPFYPALGLHDMWGNAKAQIDYSATDPFWKMEGEFYSVKKPAAKAPLVEIFVIASYAHSLRQGEWLQKAISSSTAPWKILAMNVPLISNGPHGDDDAAINKSLLPIICNKVDLVLSGHDHLFSHLREDLDGCRIEQMIVGTGGAGLYEPNPDDPRTQATESVHGFGWIEANARTLTFKMIRSDKSIFYTTVFKKN